MKKNFQILLCLLYFNQIKATLVSTRDKKKNSDRKPLNVSMSVVVSTYYLQNR